MLNQLSRLSVEADGRYATSEELQFLKDYIQSLDLRLSAYEKISAAQTEIVDLVETQVRAGCYRNLQTRSLRCIALLSHSFTQQRPGLPAR